MGRCLRDVNFPSRNRFEAITDGSNGFDQIGMDFLAKLQNVRVHRSRRRKNFITPDFVENLVAGKNFLREFGEKCEQIEFLFDQVDLGIVEADLASHGIKRKGADDTNRGLGLRSGLAQTRSHSSEKFTRFKRLRHIIARTHFETEDFIDEVGFGSQEIYRCRVCSLSHQSEEIEIFGHPAASNRE